MLRYLALLLAFVVASSTASADDYDIIGARRAADFGGHRICDPSFQGDPTIGLKDLRNSLWSSIGESSGERVSYIVGAPWCPYCANVYKLAARGDTDVEYRFIPQDPRDATGLLKMIDMVKNGAAGLERVYGGSGPYRAPSNISNHDIEFLGDALLLNAHILKMEWETAIKENYRANNVTGRMSWASPVTIEARTREGAIFPIAYVGMPLRSMTNATYIGDAPTSNSLIELVKAPPRIEPASGRFDDSNMDIVEVHSMPDEQSPRFCYEADAYWFPLQGYVNHRGQTWARISALSVSRAGSQGRPIEVSGYVRVR